MSDNVAIRRDLDQKHHFYTKKFALIKARFDKLEGRIAALEEALALATAPKTTKVKGKL